MLSVLTHAKIKTNLELQFGLLDYLVERNCLNDAEVADINREHLNDYEKIENLLKYITASNIEVFLEALHTSNQSHLANYIVKNGDNREDNRDWPLNDSYRYLIRESHRLLVQEMATKEILDELYAQGCLNAMQIEDIRKRNTKYDQNRRLLNVMLHRSVQQFHLFLKSLVLIHPHFKQLFWALKGCQEEQPMSPTVADVKPEETVNKAVPPISIKVPQPTGFAAVRNPGSTLPPRDQPTFHQLAIRPSVSVENTVSAATVARPGKPEPHLPQPPPKKQQPRVTCTETLECEEDKQMARLEAILQRLQQKNNC